MVPLPISQKIEFIIVDVYTHLMSPNFVTVSHWVNWVTLFSSLSIRSTELKRIYAQLAKKHGKRFITCQRQSGRDRAIEVPEIGIIFTRAESNATLDRNVVRLISK